MELNTMNNRIQIDLSKDEAIILFDWLNRFNESENVRFFEDQAEERILFDLEAVLEKSMNEILANDYQDRLLQAREKIRDQE